MKKGFGVEQSADTAVNWSSKARKQGRRKARSSVAIGSDTPPTKRAESSGGVTGVGLATGAAAAAAVGEESSQGTERLAGDGSSAVEEQEEEDMDDDSDDGSVVRNRSNPRRQSSDHAALHADRRGSWYAHLTFPGA